MKGEYNNNMDKIIDINDFNDDFCDCIRTGYDEPGTSACNIGKFACNKALIEPFEIYSSMVNDGICDCCDGSDEYSTKAKCNDTCQIQLENQLHKEKQRLDLLLGVRDWWVN